MKQALSTSRKRSTPATIKRVGISEIAQAAGISPAAVSSVLHNPQSKKRVSAKTRLSILSACRKLGYEPRDNPSLHQVYPELGDYCFALSTSALMGFRNPYYSQLLKSLTEAVPHSDGHIHFCQFSPEINYLSTPQSLPVPLRNNLATKVLCAGHPNLTFIEALLRRQLSVVYLGQEIPVQSVTCVTPDFLLGGRQAIEHLIKLGHRRIAVACGPFSDGSQNILQQRIAVDKTLRENGLCLSNDYTFFGSLETQGGIDAINLIAQQKLRPTALYCFNDMIAMGAIARAKEHGIRIPEDLSIVGFDDIWLAGTLVPALTTIHTPVDEIARKGVEEVERLTATSPSTSNPHLIILPTHLVERASTCSLKQ